MKVTPFTIEFDVNNVQEVSFVNGLLKDVFGNLNLASQYVPAGEPSPIEVPNVPEAAESPAEAKETVSTDEIKPKATRTRKPVEKAPEPAVVLETVEETPSEDTASVEGVTQTVAPSTAPAPSEDALTEKEMQDFIMSLMKNKVMTRPQITDVFLEFGAASLSRIDKAKYKLLKFRLDHYND